MSHGDDFGHLPPASPAEPPGNGTSVPVATDEHAELMDLAQEAGGFGVFELHIGSGRVSLSPNLLRLYGLKDVELDVPGWRDRIFREDRIRVRDHVADVYARHGREVDVEFRIVHGGDGSLRWICSRALVFYDLEGKPERMVGVNIDITNQKRMLMQLRAFTETLEDRVRERTQAVETAFSARQKAEDLLRQAQKMEAVGQLTGGVAHDFNNLLTVVLGGLESISRQIPNLPESPATARILRSKDMAVQGVQRAAVLTNRLLAFSRQQPLAPSGVDANRLVTGVSELLRRSLGEQVALETVLAGGLWPTFADPNQLENTLLNLAVNARDAMPTGGKLTIETGNASLDAEYVAALTEPVAAGHYVMVAVTDTGKGMDADTRERAFEPFFTTKSVGKGTGLGLSQVYGFVRQSSGHIRIYSEPGEGTTVKLYLPRHHGPAEFPELLDGSLAPMPAGTECILLVEDDDSVRAYAVEMLHELGYGVLEADNGATALELLDSHPKIELLFTDVVMPGPYNGRQLADEALRRRPDLKVLFTTGYTRNAIVHHGRLDPGVHLISKPYSFRELAAKIRARLDALD